MSVSDKAVVAEDCSGGLEDLGILRLLPPAGLGGNGGRASFSDSIFCVPTLANPWRIGGNSPPFDA